MFIGGGVYGSGTAPMPAPSSPAWATGAASGRGYWLFTDKGQVLTFGDAPHLGDLTAVRINGPVRDSVPTPTGRGYYLVASLLTAASSVSAMPASLAPWGRARLNAPVQSLVPSAGGRATGWLPPMTACSLSAHRFTGPRACCDSTDRLAGWWEAPPGVWLSEQRFSWTSGLAPPRAAHSRLSPELNPLPQVSRLDKQRAKCRW